MKIINKIKIANFLKKRYIHKELKMKFNKAKKDDNEYLNILTNSIFKASQGVKAYVIAKENNKYLYETEGFLNDVKAVVEKHYKQREESLKKENAKLRSDIKRKTNIEKKFEVKSDKHYANLISRLEKI